MVKADFLPCSDARVSAFFPRFSFKDEDIVIALLLRRGEHDFAGGLIKKLDPERYEIIHILVEENLRQKGIGSLVIRFLEERIRTMGGRYSIIHPPLFLLNHLEDDGYRYYRDVEGRPGPFLAKFLEAGTRRYR